MPKTKISEYDTTPSSNSDMAGIDISEGCSPAGINDAIRAGMSHLKKMDNGTDAMTSPVFTTATMSGGSINSTTVGATTASTGAFTDLTADTFTLNSVAIGSADFTKLSGITVTATEINSLDGASSTQTMQAQMDNKAPLASPALTGTPTAPTPTAGDSSTQIATTAFVGTQVASSTPAGAVLSFAMNTAPTGWLECDGAAIARTTYATLFAAIGTTFGEGDGSTTFNIPDLRGVLFEAGPIQEPTLMRIICMMLAETSVQSKLTRLNRTRILLRVLLDHLGLEQVVVTLCQKRKIPAQLAG